MLGMEILVIIGLILLLLVLWIISVQRKFAVMDGNIQNAMNQIGVQLSSRFDALLSLLDFTKKYAGYEAQTLTDEEKWPAQLIDGKAAIRYLRANAKELNLDPEKRCIIMETSTPEEVLRQEGVINEVLFRTQTVLEEYPGSTDENEYIKCMDAVECYEKMVQTSRLIYNDSVTKLNRELHIFPTSVLAHMLGFEKRDYLVEN